MKIKFDEKTKKWIELPNNSKEGFYIDKMLFKKLQNIKKIQKKGYDCVLLIDGGRREGKSILGHTCAWILSDCNLTLDNFAIGSIDAKDKIEKLPDRSLLFVDEGSAIFSSKDAMKKELKELIKIIDVVGMKEMIFIIVLPSFFDLVKPIAIRMSRFLLHVYTDKDMNRGRFAYFGTAKKKYLYSIGKKNFDSYTKPKANFIGRFTNFTLPFYNEYLKLKRKTLMNVLKGGDRIITKTERTTIYLEIIKNNEMNPNKLNHSQLAQLLGTSRWSIRRLIIRYKEIEENRA